MEISESYGRVNIFKLLVSRKNSEKKDIKFYKYGVKYKFQKKKLSDGI